MIEHNSGDLLENTSYVSLDAKTRDCLCRKLLSNGWFWEGDFIYAPNRMLWLYGSDPWHGDLLDFHETFSARVQRIIRMKVHHPDPKQHQQVVDDNQSLVSTLQEMLKEKRIQAHA